MEGPRQVLEWPPRTESGPQLPASKKSMLPITKKLNSANNLNELSWGEEDLWGTAWPTPWFQLCDWAERPAGLPGLLTFRNCEPVSRYFWCQGYRGLSQQQPQTTQLVPTHTTSRPTWQGALKRTHHIWYFPAKNTVPNLIMKTHR